MAENSKIEWCDHTVNFWWGCTKISPACAHCYAEKLAKFFSRGRASWGPDGLRWLRTIEAECELKDLQRKAAKRGVIERVFINSMSDTFEDRYRSDLDSARNLLFSLVWRLPNLRLLLLTKRPENIMRMVPQSWHDAWPENVWIGTTVEDQTRADERIPELLKVPAPIRFLSCEPMLGAVDIWSVTDRWENAGGELPGDWRRTNPFYINWVICGGESGPGARPMHPAWAISLRDQCQAAGVPFFFKQWGEWCPRGPESFGYPAVDGVPRIRLTNAGQNGQDLASEGGDEVWMNRAGKNRTGRTLAGRKWDEIPGVESEVVK